MWVKKEQLEPDTEQLTGPKLGKEYDMAVQCLSAYLTSVKGTSSEMLGWMTHRLESRLMGEINNLRYTDDTTLRGRLSEN